MLDPTIIDDLIALYTADELRTLLLHNPYADERAGIIAAIYYLEGTDND